MRKDEETIKALAMQAARDGRFGPAVTPGTGTGPDGVTGAAGPAKSAAMGVRGGAEDRGTGKKIAGSSAAARAPEAAAPAKTKPNRRENEFMLNLMILRNTLRVNAPANRERARRAGKWIWRDIRLMQTLVERVQGALLATMPDSRDDYYRAYAEHGHYELHITGPVRTPRKIVVTDKHLGTICDAAMRSECILCMREGSEIGQCLLREALLEAAPPSEVEDDGDIRRCEYRDAAGQLVQGEDVTI